MRARLLWSLIALVLLNACAGMSFSALEATAIATTGASVAAATTENSEPLQVKVYGTYEDGFWFDRDLYSVWVVSGSAAESKRIAFETAIRSCDKRGSVLKLIKMWEWQERKLFIPIKDNRFSFEMRFRCKN